MNQRIRLWSSARFCLCSFVAVLGSFTSALSQDVVPQAPQEFSFSSVIDVARKLAEDPYRADSAQQSDPMIDLSYDEYRTLRFRKEASLWQGDALFGVDLFHTGFLFNKAVSISEVIAGQPSEVAYSRGWFDIDEQLAAKLKPSANYGYGGFKLTYPLHSAGVNDDVAVFLGASYFKAVGRGNFFGLSARGLAVDTAEPGGEEFPSFKKFWLVKPEKTDTSVTVWALLDSPSVTGAYSFKIHPGQEMTVNCTAKLFFRNSKHKFGFAPLTSMFLRGEGSNRRGDFRPEVHNSDSLLMLTGTDGEWLFRPLSNPGRAVRTTRFSDINPRGFGLVQRDRNYDNYLDLETHYEDRPDFWVEPLEDWGRGSVELVEIATEFETNDNVVAYWVPEQIGDKKEFSLSYRLTAGTHAVNHNKAKVIRSLLEPVDAGSFGLDPEEKEATRFIVDFQGLELGSLKGDQPMHTELSLLNGTYRHLTIVKDEKTGNWRVSFVAIRDKNKAVDLRLQLQLYGEPLSESWLYIWDTSSQ